MALIKSLVKIEDNLGKPFSTLDHYFMPYLENSDYRDYFTLKVANNLKMRDWNM